jgi:predicted ATP-binding protein involved in virulence
MKVKSISVNGLFGVFDHDIPLQNPDGVTIIHGPNGFGKTTILRMIGAVATGNASVFEHTPFSEFRLVLEDNTTRIIRRTVEKKNGVGSGLRRLRRPRRSSTTVKLQFFIEDTRGNVSEAQTPLVPSEVPPHVLQDVDRLVPGPFGLAGDLWVNPEDGNTYSLAEILEMFPEAVNAIPKEYRPPLFQDELPPVFFVETNRLGGQSTPRTGNYGQGEIRYQATGGQEIPPPRVEQYSGDIAQRIRSVLAEYGRHSQERDRTFPERLVRFMRERDRALSERDILTRMEELENKRKRLMSLGLLESERGLRDLTEADMSRAPEALTIYVGDVEEKLKVFDDLAQRIGSLIDILNNRFRYKRLTLDRDRGFRVISDSDQPIQLEDLSSGEQHELVVLYELLFRAPSNALVLVDEPEISLHVAWQSRFLPDLINIVGLTDSYAIVATHSPVIIGNRSDLRVELEGPDNLE